MHCEECGGLELVPCKYRGCGNTTPKKSTKEVGKHFHACECAIRRTLEGSFYSKVTTIYARWAEDSNFAWPRK